MRFVPHL
jgi:hypothetical protein